MTFPIIQSLEPIPANSRSSAVAFEATPTSHHPINNCCTEPPPSPWATIFVLFFYNLFHFSEDEKICHYLCVIVTLIVFFPFRNLMQLHINPNNPKSHHHLAYCYRWWYLTQLFCNAHPLNRAGLFKNFILGSGVTIFFENFNFHDSQGCIWSVSTSKNYNYPVFQVIENRLSLKDTPRCY